jgi:hypothetical protein
MSLVETISANTSPAIRWFKELFTRQSLIDGLKAITWVVPLTILIWVYAEEQKPVGSQEQTLQVEFHSSDQDRMVTPVNQSDDMIMVKLTGPKSNVDSAVEAFTKPGDNPLVRIEVPSSFKDGATNLGINESVRDAEIFKKYGVTVDQVSPSSIYVNIDTMKTLDVNVEPRPSDLLEKGAQTIFDPRTVRITAPERILQKAKDAGQTIVAYAQIPLLGDISGIHEGVLVPVSTLLQGENVTVTPGSVKASYTVKQNDKTADIPSLSIFRVFGGGLEDQYSVEGAKTNLPVTISGPQIQVDNVMRNLNTSTPPYAYFRVDSSESSQPSVTKNLSWNFGEANPNIRVLDNPPDTVTYTVKKRQSSP